MFTAGITAVGDVEAFFSHLVTVEKLNFHPDQDFADCVSLENGSPSFTQEQALQYNALMDAAFAVCRKEGADIYAIGMQQLKGNSGA